MYSYLGVEVVWIDSKEELCQKFCVAGSVTCSVPRLAQLKHDKVSQWRNEQRPANPTGKRMSAALRDKNK